MPLSSTFLIPLCMVGALYYSPAAAQTAPPASKRQLTPRELFYKTGPADTSQKGKKKSSQGGGSTKGPDDSTASGGTSLPGGGKISTISASPIGVTYTLQKLIGGVNVDVATDTVFHAGDGIQIVVQTNYPGYLYIGNQGPGGAWNPLFPSPEIENGNNHIERLRKYTLPPGYQIKFDKNAGVERVFILFSREPVPDFEKLLYSQPNGSKAAGKSVDGKAAPKPLNVAKADIPASTVDRLRAAYSRDLFIEKIDDEKPGSKEKAIYALAPSIADMQLWYEFQLVHK